MANGWYPKAVEKRIPAGSSDPEITPALAILHVDAGNSGSLFDFFRARSGGIESHFFVRKDGVVEQYRSVHREADANLGANSYLIGGRRFGAVSIETQGLGAGWWNKAQKAAIKELLLWLNREHGIRLRAVRLPQPDVEHGGVSYHSRFRSWSPVVKSCPGPRRIRQYKTWLLPWMSTVRNCTHCPVHCPKEG